MKILCVIDHFGPGGAQRQIVNLAAGLKAKGHHVEMFVYFPDQKFFRPLVDQLGILVHEVHKSEGFSLKVVWQLVQLLRANEYTGVISFLNSPSVYAEIAKVLNQKTILIVSERSSHLGDGSRLSAFFRRALHVGANFVVSNSRSHAEWLAQYWWLKEKVVTIYNGYAMERHRLSTQEHYRGFPRLLVVGRVGPEKNGLRLIEALARFYRKHGFTPEVAWAGRRDSQGAGIDYCHQMDELLERNAEVKAKWKWLGERSDIPDLLHQYHALVHPSLYEGLPNVVCEAMVAGRPVLASQVCDHPILVEAGRTGFLYDPLDSQSIADAIERFAALSSDQWLQFCASARQFAETNLSIDRMVGGYEALLTGSCSEVR